ncbi:MAG: C45 family autoproteolytic acyltransferase/hydrolase [Coprococcus sp.]
MNKKGKKFLCIGLTAAMFLTSTACGQQKENLADLDTNNAEYVLQPVENYFTEDVYEYTDEGIRQSVEETFVSGDGLCTILVYPDYYDVTLDYESGTPEKVGTAYAKTILEAFPAYEEILEPYIYENVRMAFSGQNINYDVLENRMNVLLDSIPEEYRAEIKAFAAALSDGEQGFAENGKISYEEAVIVQMIPDALRPTACSALSLWGDKTETGKGITLRSLEWNLGSENQMGKANAVVHMEKGDRSITSIGILGLLGMISAVNDNGVFVGILDVGATDYPFVYEGKTCYTYAIRYALEEYDNAMDVGNYMVANSGNFTWCHNLIITDENNSYCAEDCVREVAEAGDGFSILRDADTPIMEGLNWESRDSLCVLNSFMTEGNQDTFSGSTANLVRFRKYNEWVSARERFSVANVKDMMTQEKTAQYDVENVHRNSVVHIVLIDYCTGNIQVAFTGEEGVMDKPLFLDVGGF